MKQDQSGWLLECVEHARRGEKAAKDTLLLTLEKPRKPIILWYLRNGDVRWSDRADAHHDVVVRIAEKIEQLREPRSYFTWERRIINEVCEKYRRHYRRLAEPPETILSELAGQARFVGAMYEQLH